LEFYRFFRQKIARDAEKSFGKYGKLATDVLLAGPDLFIFLFRLYRDPDLPLEHKLALGAVITYWLLPIDFISEMFLGILGYADDILLASFILCELLQHLDEKKIKEYWPGPNEVHIALSKILAFSNTIMGFMGKNMRGRFEQLVKRIISKMEREEREEKPKTEESAESPNIPTVNENKFLDFSLEPEE